MKKTVSNPEIHDIILRDVTMSDLPIFFEQQLDPQANQMAAFTAKDPADRDAFMAKWAKILGDETSIVQTILIGEQVAGSVLIWTDEELDGPEVSYWIGKSYWGKGVATRALSEFLHSHVKDRPLYGRAVHDNIASLRVLEKCGFRRIGEGNGFANARGEEVEEYILKLD
jgi:RimJ/RimL family protein N-acetyltransferase